MALVDEKLTSRAVFLARFHDDLVVRLQDAGIESGIPDALSGVTMLSVGKFEEVLEAAFRQPLPPPVETYAEVRTPARVLVSALCPRCDMPAAIVLEVHPELVVDDEGAELRLKPKSKARAHVCGQLSIEDVAPAVPADQMSLALMEGGRRLEARVVEDEEVTAVPDGPYAVCGAGAALQLDPEDEGNVRDAVCGLELDHSDRGELEEHVDLNPPRVAWRWVEAALDPELAETPEADVEPADAVAGAGDPDGLGPDAPLADSPDDPAD